MQDLDDVRVFTRVVQAGSFTAAARQLGMPKSTVSRRVSALEDALGARLLQRTTRKLSLTDVGEAYFARTARVVAELDEAERVVSDMQAAPRGLLRVTVPVDFALTVLAGVLAEFREAHPEIEVIVWATGQVVDLVAEGYDVALRAGRMTDSSLVAVKVAEADLRMYASCDYLRGRGEPERLEDLQQHDCLLFGTDGLTDIWKLDGPDGKREEVAVSGPLASNDFAFLRTLTLAHLGIARLPCFEAEQAVADGRLRPVLEGYALRAGGLYAVYPSAQYLTPKVRAFIDFMREKLAERLGVPA